MNSLIGPAIQLLVAIFGPLATAKILSEVRVFIEEIKDPVIRAEIDRSYNEIRARRDSFMQDRDDHQQQS